MKDLVERLVLCGALVILSVYVTYYTVNDVISENNFYSGLLVIGDENSSEFTRQWMQPDVNESMRIYVYKQLSDAPSPQMVAPVGPFDFIVHQRKQVIDETDDELTYEPIVTYSKNDTHATDGNFTQVIRMPNVPLLTAISILAQRSPQRISSEIKLFLDHWEHKELIVEHRVNEFTFDGYSDQLTKFIDSIQWMFPEPLLKDGKFRLLFNASNSEGKITVSKGVDNIKKSGQLIAWNGKHETDFYAPGSICNKIHGSTGQNFGALVYETKLLYVFIPEFCSAVPFKFARNTYTFGVKTRRFEFDFNDPKLDTCFAHQGMHDASRCNKNAPIVLTAPCFNSTNGTCPDGVSFIEIEPTSGVTLKASIRFLLNLNIGGNSSLTSNSTILTPVLQIERNADVQSVAINGLLKLKTYRSVFLGISWSLIVLLLLFVILCLARTTALLVMRIRKQKDDQVPIVSEDASQ